MKFDPDKQCAHAEVAKLAALYGPALTEEEQRAHRQRVAAEMAAANRYREALPHPSGFRVDPANGIVFGLTRRPIGVPNDRGYVQVRLGTKSLAAHRVVYESVHGPIPKGKEINHINGVKDDNRIANLELVTPSENLRHAYRTGLKDSKGEAHSRAKLTDAKVRAIRGSLGNCSSRFLAMLFGVSISNIQLVRSGKAWPHVSAEARRRDEPQLELPE